MESYTLETNGNEYLIRLKKDDLELSFLECLLDRIQKSRSYFSLTVQLDHDDTGDKEDRDDSSLRFDRLEDK
jgi:hypothetical protein